MKDRLLTSLSGPFGFDADAATRILCYHDVSARASSISIDPKVFRQQIECLVSMDIRVMTLSQWHDWCLREGEVPARCAVLTFDDGYRSMLTDALPILDEFGLAGTLFVVTDYIGQTNAYDKQLGSPELEILNWDELAQLKQKGWDIQSHGRQHFAMSQLSDAQVTDELAGSRALLEDRLGDSIKYFCFPYGLYRQNSINLLKNCGYEGAVTCNAGVVADWAEQDPYRLPRVVLDGIEAREDFEFRFTRAYRRLSGCAQWMRKVRGGQEESCPDPSEKDLLKRVP